MINKKAKQEVEWEEPPRPYSESELLDFHQKIQRFWGEPRTLSQEVYGGKIAQRFNWEEMAMAYGACRKVQHGLKYIYLYNQDGKRDRELNNLWKQYLDYLRRKDYGEQKRLEELDKVAEEMAF